MTEVSFHLVGNLTKLHHDSFIRFVETFNFKLNKEIVLYINSAGGDSNVATSIYLKLRGLKTKGIHITTIGDINIKSGAFLIYLAGDIRLSYKDCTFMYHHHFKPSNFNINLKDVAMLNDFISKEKLFEQAKIIEDNNKKMDDEISKITGIEKQGLRKLENLDFDVQKAMKLNIVNKIIFE